MSQYSAPQDQLEQIIKQALKIETERAIQNAITAAQKEVEKKIREATASIVAQVQTRMSFERFGHELVIRVNFDNTQKIS